MFYAAFWFNDGCYQRKSFDTLNEASSFIDEFFNDPIAKYLHGGLFAVRILDSCFRVKTDYTLLK